MVQLDYMIEPSKYGAQEDVRMTPPPTKSTNFLVWFRFKQSTRRIVVTARLAHEALNKASVYMGDNGNNPDASPQDLDCAITGTPRYKEALKLLRSREDIANISKPAV